MEESVGPEGGSRKALGAGGGGGGGPAGRAKARWGGTVFTNTQTEEGTPLDDLPQEELKVIPRGPPRFLHHRFIWHHTTVYFVYIAASLDFVQQKSAPRCSSAHPPGLIGTSGQRAPSALGCLCCTPFFLKIVINIYV